MNIDPKPVIQRAYDRATILEMPMYVHSNGQDFVLTSKQPPATKSHWRVDPSGYLDAHVDAYPDQIKYTYERV